MTGPDRAAALEQYRRRARVYDLELALFEPVRRRAIERLQLRPGDTVLDVGCGTGLSLASLHAGVGSRGRVVGIEQSPPMIAQARERVRRGRWRQVTLLEAPVESAPIDVRADAALFHFTHDVLRRPDAVAQVVRHLAPGARVVATGLQWVRGWRRPLNLFVLPAARRSVTTLDGLDAPWSHLERWCGPLEIEDLLFGAVYLAAGRCARTGSRSRRRR